jgi:hypothetical protein
LNSAQAGKNSSTMIGKATLFFMMNLETIPFCLPYR